MFKLRHGRRRRFENFVPEPLDVAGKTFPIVPLAKTQPRNCKAGKTVKFKLIDVGNVKITERGMEWREPRLAIGGRFG
jgi:hypothetical protein